MDSRVMDYLMRKMDNRDSRYDFEDGRRDVRGSGRGRDSADRAGSRDYSDGYEDGYEDARRDMRDMEDNRDSEDSRRGVRGSGRRDRADNRDNRDSEDSKHLKLTKSDMHEWKRMLENADGTMGPHYDMQQILSMAERHDIKFKKFSEAELCMTTNMMYADYCRALKKFVEPDKLLECCICLAKGFLEDEDGPDASEKLALYYHCIVNA